MTMKSEAKATPLAADPGSPVFGNDVGAVGGEVGPGPGVAVGPPGIEVGAGVGVDDAGL